MRREPGDVVCGHARPRASSARETAATPGRRRRLQRASDVRVVDRRRTGRARPTAPSSTRSSSTRARPTHLYIGMSCGGVFESRRRGPHVDAAQSGLRCRLPPRCPTPSMDTTRTASFSIRSCRTGSTSRTIAASTASTGRRIDGNESAAQCRRRSATSASRSSFTRATRTPPGSSRWTATSVWPRTPERWQAGGLPHARRGSIVPSAQDRGLPAAQAWFTVKRQAMAADAFDPVGLYFGTTGGEVWASPDEGEQLATTRRASPAHLLDHDGKPRRVTA